MAIANSTPVKRFVILFFASGIGTGYSPIASGTVSTLIVGIPLYLLFTLMSDSWYVIALFPFIALSVYFSGAADRILGEKDSHKIVIDELAGFLVTMCLLPPTSAAIAAGFLLFRLFDIVKLQPAKWVEDNFPGGMGVVFDDIVAGIYSNIVLRIGLLLYPLIF